MEINIEGKRMLLDVNRAREAGALSEIPNIKAGHLFKSKKNGYFPVVIVHCEYGTDKYAYAGLNGLALYSNKSGTAAEVYAWLMENKYSFVCNLNEEIDRLISSNI